MGISPKVIMNRLITRPRFSGSAYIWDKVMFSDMYSELSSPYTIRKNIAETNSAANATPMMESPQNVLMTSRIIPRPFRFRIDASPSVPKRAPIPITAMR